MEEIKPKLSLAFVDVFDSFDKSDNRYTQALSRHFDLITNEEKPQLLFYSCFGTEHLRYNESIRIFFNGENLFPNFNICDYAIGSLRDGISGRNMYQPSALYMYDNRCLPATTRAMASRKFCSFIYSQDNFGQGAQLRKLFCKKLMNEYKHVDCPGKILHNMDAPFFAERSNPRYWHESKVRFLSEYKFNIAFENSNTDGYLTEKLLDPFMANCIPIYWGGAGITSPFPKDAMIYVQDYPDLDALIERIREVDQNDDLYLEMLSNNPLRHGVLKDPVDELEKFLLPIALGCNQSLTKDPGLRDPIHRVSDFALMSTHKLNRLRKLKKFFSMFF